MNAKQAVTQFMHETGTNDPEVIIDLLCDWFDEHDSAEKLVEYLEYCRD